MSTPEEKRILRRARGKVGELEANKGIVNAKGETNA